MNWLGRDRKMNIKSFLKSAIKVLSGHMAFKWHKRPDGLYCFNYHRIGDAASSEFDPNLYSCSEERFAQHLQFIKQNFDVISIEDLIALNSGSQKISERLAIITFDDGYIDNYKLAYPILKSAGVPAAFYVPTDFIDKPEIPWWDEVAWLTRQANVSSIKLPHWKNAVNVADGSITMRVRRLLRAVKRDDGISMAEKLTLLKERLQLETARMPQPDELFINWVQLNEMADNGMHIGSHTLSHNILSHLSVEQQLYELTQSKNRLETMLNRPVTSVAYPVGGVNAFTVETQKLALQAGYKLAFSFIAGINRHVGDDNRYQLRRFPVDDNASVWKLKQMINSNFVIKEGKQ
jgi:peptidoglycan/xylan/chitin deacetylase (PgdA/CDA1 family)